MIYFSIRAPGVDGNALLAAVKDAPEVGHLKEDLRSMPELGTVTSPDGRTVDLLVVDEWYPRTNRQHAQTLIGMVARCAKVPPSHVTLFRLETLAWGHDEEAPLDQ